VGQINEKRGTSKPNENVIALQPYIFLFHLPCFC